MKNYDQFSHDIYIPGWLLFDDKIPNGPKFLYARIRGIVKTRGYCFASNKSLAEWSQVSERTIRTYLSKLSELGLIVIKIEPRKGGGWLRVIWLAEDYERFGKEYEKLGKDCGKACGKACGKLGGKKRKQAEKIAGQAEVNKGNTSGQAEGFTNKRFHIYNNKNNNKNNVTDFLKFSPDNVSAQWPKGYWEARRKLLDKFSMAGPTDRTAAQEEASAEIRPSGKK